MISKIYLYLCALAVRSIIGFLGAMKNSSILLWIVSLLIFYRGCFAVVRSCLFLDFPCAVSDSVVLHIGGNPGVHSISVSKHHLELNALRNSLCTSYPIHLLSDFFFPTPVDWICIWKYKRRSQYFYAVWHFDREFKKIVDLWWSQWSGHAFAYFFFPESTSSFSNASRYRGLIAFLSICFCSRFCLWR